MCTNTVSSHRLLLLALAIILVAVLITPGPSTASAYKTFELVKYCHRRQIVNKSVAGVMLKANKIYKMEAGPDLIVRDNYDRFELEEDDDHDEDDEENVYAQHHTIEDEEDEEASRHFKSVAIESNKYDRSAVRVVLKTPSAGSRHKPVYKNWQHCALFVHAKRPDGLIVTVDKLRLRPGVDRLRLSINNGSFVREFSHVTIENERDSVAYVANHGVLIELETGYSLQSPGVELPVGIELILTSFREADMCKIEGEFDCGSFRCISSNYLCDGQNNCGDGRDEVGCPIDNITNYILISGTLLLVAFLIFVCLCYRCFCAKKQRGPPAMNRPCQYVKIRSGSISSAAPRGRSASMRSEGQPESGNMRRFKVTQVTDSTPLLYDAHPAVPSAPEDYGSTTSTVTGPTPYFHPPAYAYTYLSPTAVGYVPAPTMRILRTSSISAGDPRLSSTHFTFPMRPNRYAQGYPVLHPQLFQPPPPPPPPYTPRDETNQPGTSSSNNNK